MGNLTMAIAVIAICLLLSPPNYLCLSSAEETPFERFGPPPSPSDLSEPPPPVDRLLCDNFSNFSSACGSYLANNTKPPVAGDGCCKASNETYPEETYPGPGDGYSNMEFCDCMKSTYNERTPIVFCRLHVLPGICGFNTNISFKFYYCNPPSVKDCKNMMSGPPPPR